MKTLIVAMPDGNKEVFVLDKKEIFIGRDHPKSNTYNDLNLPHNSVSRRHAKILLKKQAYCIEDLKSHNRTFVNKDPISFKILEPGDLIGIGIYTLQFLSQDTVSVNPLDYLVKPAALDPGKTIDSNYFILQRLSELLVTQTEISEFLRLVRVMVMESIKAATVIILLTEPEGTPFLIVPEEESGFSREVVNQVLLEKKSVLVGFDLPASKTMLHRGVYSAMCAPLIKGDKVSGVIYAEDPMPGVFAEGDLILLSLFANQLVIGMERVEMNTLLQREAIIRANLERFFSPKVVQMITRDSEEQSDFLLKSERMRASILFSDIQKFTHLCEKLHPEEIVDLLSRFFNLMAEIIFKYEGTLDKYIGDGLIAVFGAPGHDPDHPQRAVQTAVEMIRQHRDFVGKLPQRQKFNIRIGVNTGEIVAGYMGSAKRMEYSVLGEAVIVAHRLETMAQAGSIFIGRETYESVKDLFNAEREHKKNPKGDKVIECFKIIPD